MTTYTTHPTTPTNGAPIFDPQHPLAALLAQATQLLDELHRAAARVENALAVEAIARARAKDAQETLDAAEAELVLEAVVLADAGDGALKGIAKTSKAYTYAIDNLLAQARAGALAHLADDARRLKIAADGAKSELDQAQARFSAVKHAADLAGNILRAATN